MQLLKSLSLHCDLLYYGYFSIEESKPTTERTFLSHQAPRIVLDGYRLAERRSNVGKIVNIVAYAKICAPQHSAPIELTVGTKWQKQNIRLERDLQKEA